jgi:hypothetical protein
MKFKEKLLHQQKRFPVYLLPGMMIMIILGIIVLLSGFREDSVVVQGLGIFFLISAVYYFWTY